MKHSETPEEICGDSSTEIVLNAIASNHPIIKGMNQCTANHFDIDAFCSVWALLHPDEALRHKASLRECAHIGDFRELGTDPAPPRIKPANCVCLIVRVV